MRQAERKVIQTFDREPDTDNAGVGSITFFSGDIVSGISYFIFRKDARKNV